jgi:hypothetical protein
MPPPGKINPNARRVLENLAVAGSSSIAELDTLDPVGAPHARVIKTLRNGGYIASDDSYKLPDEPCRYYLNEKSRALLNNESVSRLRAERNEPVVPTALRRYEPPKATPPITYGSMTTGRMVSPCADMLAPATREGAEIGLQIPSRVNDVLHYRDGRRVCVHTGVAI